MTYKVKAWTNQVFNAQPLYCYLLCLYCLPQTTACPQPSGFAQKSPCQWGLSYVPYLKYVALLLALSHSVLFMFFVVLTSSWQYFEFFPCLGIQLECQSCGSDYKFHSLLCSLEFLAHSRLSINIYWMKELINKGIYVLCTLYFYFILKI